MESVRSVELALLTGYYNCGCASYSTMDDTYQNQHGRCSEQVKCSYCNGRGWIHENCSTCGGDGYVNSYIYCEHGFSTSHYYCQHGNNIGSNKHD